MKRNFRRSKLNKGSSNNGFQFAPPSMEVQDENVMEATSNSEIDPIQLFEQANSFLDQCENQNAVNLYSQALQILCPSGQTPSNAELYSEVLDGFAEILIQIDMFEEAKNVLLRSIELMPESGEGKYLWLGQLMEGEDSLQCYRHAISLMSQDLEEMSSNVQNSDDQLEVKMLEKSIAEVYCSIAELYLTDLCFENKAEEKCEKALQRALELDPVNPTVFSTFASFRISQQKPQDAIVFLRQAYDSFKYLPIDQYPPFEVRHSLAKLMLEVEMLKEAIEIWMGLLEEDDTVAEIYNFLGQAWRPVDSQTSLEYLNLSYKHLQESNCQDQELMNDLEQLISIVQTENNVGNIDLEFYNLSEEENMDQDDQEDVDIEE